MVVLLHEDKMILSKDVPLNPFFQKIINFFRIPVIDCRPKRKKRRRPKNSGPYKRFKERVFKIWGGRCIKCGGEENITVHHTYLYSKDKDYRLDADASVPLCVECHKYYHENYKPTPQTLFDYIWGN